jgi:hypothetical protein
MFEGPNWLYLVSMKVRISATEVPELFIRITSRVMSTQMPQPKA